MILQMTSFEKLMLIYHSISLVLIGIALISYIEEKRIRKRLFDEKRRQYFQDWYKDIYSNRIQLDLPPNEKLNEDERYLIRGYWHRVILEEFSKLEIWNKKRNSKSWRFWEEQFLDGLCHNTILQEFSYFAKYEVGQSERRKDLVELVISIYSKKTGISILIEELLRERKRQTRTTT